MWKIFEQRDGRPWFLYHGLAGRREVTLDAWLLAERKWVKEGSNPYYWSGFHIYTDIDAVRKWIHRATRLADRRCVSRRAALSGPRAMESRHPVNGNRSTK